MAPPDPRRVMDILKRYGIPDDEARRIVEESLVAAARRSRQGQEYPGGWLDAIVEARCREYVGQHRTVEEGDLEDDDEPSGS